MSVQNWEHFFKPEVRTSGRSLFNQGKVALSSPSDTEIIIYIRATTSFKVSFKTQSVDSEKVTVDCNCPAGKKNQFCKHVWAGLLATAEKKPDFLESKTEIQKNNPLIKTVKNDPPSSQSQAREATQVAFKLKQDSYRKQQYQKQKQRSKAFKELKKGVPVKSQFPPDVENAIKFFSLNGIELQETLNKESIGAAKKKLARVFHPDFGGSHQEILELNSSAEVLIEFVSR